MKKLIKTNEFFKNQTLHSRTPFYDRIMNIKSETQMCDQPIDRQMQLMKGER